MREYGLTSSPSSGVQRAIVVAIASRSAIPGRERAMEKLLAVGLLAILVLGATWLAPEASWSRSESRTGLVGESTSRVPPDGHKVDLYVSADQSGDLMLSFAADPEMYVGTVNPVGLVPFVGGDRMVPSNVTSRSLASADLVARAPPPASLSSRFSSARVKLPGIAEPT
jgi:hypothetical protein